MATRFVFCHVTTGTMSLQSKDSSLGAFLKALREEQIDCILIGACDGVNPWVDPIDLNRLKGALGIVGGTGFLIGGVLVALSARKYQLSGAAMPNGKGGFMSFRDGYYVSFVLVAMAAAWIYFGYRSGQAALASQENELPSSKN